MNDILKEIVQYNDKNEININLKNSKLFTHIKCYSTICKTKLLNFLTLLINYSKQIIIAKIF